MTPRTLTHSAIQTYKDCPEKYKRRYVDAIELIAPRAEALQLGGVVHDALEIWHSLTEPPPSWGVGHPIHDFVCSAYPRNQFDQWVHAIAMMEAYCQTYPWQEDADAWEIVCLERVFAQPIVNPETGFPSNKFHQEGKVDGVIRLRDSGDYALLEHKTAARVDEQYIDKLWMDRQIHQYAHYMGLELGIDIKWVVYNILGKNAWHRRKGKDNPTKQTETDADFLDRMRKVYKGNASKNFTRVTIPVLPETTEEVTAEVWDVKDLIMASERTGRYYKNTQACWIFNRRCQYWNLCRFGESVRDMYQDRVPHSELQESDGSGSPFDI